MNSEEPTASGALYYPYIHIRDVNWLRASLLIFSNVRRMIPMDFMPADTPEVRELATWADDAPPLLRSADLFSERSIQAQKNLASRLREDSASSEFVSLYGKDAARAMVSGRSFGFQIHAEKLSDDLKDALSESNRIAWEPIRREPHDRSSEYVEVHPRVGEAIMSTLAVACAQASGLDIIGDERSGALHRCLLEKDLDAIYETWLKPGSKIEPPRAATGSELFEFIIGFPGDLSVLTAEKLRAVAAEREPIVELIHALRERAAQIPLMDPGEEREDAFKQAASEVMRKWAADRNNFSGFAREFFSAGTVKLTTSFVSKVADKTLTGMAAGAAAKATATAAAGGTGWLGSLAAGGVIGAGAGLIIGLIAHGGKTYYRRVQAKKESPYRFLTTLEEAGVVLQSEAILA